MTLPVPFRKIGLSLAVLNTKHRNDNLIITSSYYPIHISFLNWSLWEIKDVESFLLKIRTIIREQYVQLHPGFGVRTYLLTAVRYFSHYVTGTPLLSKGLRFEFVQRLFFLFFIFLALCFGPYVFSVKNLFIKWFWLGVFLIVRTIQTGVYIFVIFISIFRSVLSSSPFPMRSTNN